MLATPSGPAVADDLVLRDSTAQRRASIWKSGDNANTTVEDPLDVCAVNDIGSVRMTVLATGWCPNSPTRNFVPRCPSRSRGTMIVACYRAGSQARFAPNGSRRADESNCPELFVTADNDTTIK